MLLLVCAGSQVPGRECQLDWRQAAVGLLLAGMLAAPGARALNRPGTIRITDVQSSHTHVQIGQRARAGDLDVYRLLLHNRRITSTPIGRARMLCMSLGAGTWSCWATYFLPKGEIVAEGVIGTRLIYRLAVVGGTGLYDNVRGTLTVTSLKRTPPQELLVFRLVV